MSRLGVDIGGTFTDAAVVDNNGVIRLAKSLTDYDAHHELVVSMVAESGVDLSSRDTIVAHGTTLVINALLERQGSDSVLVTTRGFADVLDIGPGSRPETYNFRYRRMSPFIPRGHRIEVSERTSGQAEVLRAPSLEELDDLSNAIRELEPRSIAIAFINSFANPSNERLVAGHLRASFPEVPISISSDLSQRPREWERFMTAAANAYVAPRVATYLSALEAGLRARSFVGDAVVLDSNGGAMAIDIAARFPIRTVESGPVAGVLASAALAHRHGVRFAVSFDMGGTTAKSSLIEDGEIDSTDVYWIGGYSRGLPVQLQAVGIIEVGAGGGSIAWSDRGRLRVGPRSAGSDPGPACYGRGGTEPTVTDANLYCGHLPQRTFSAGLELDVDAARIAIEGLASQLEMPPRRLALGILRLATVSMASAVRQQTLERGRDPREFWLVASGGAGPMHACDVAAEVGIGRVAIPVHPGHFSAIGMLGADLHFERSRSLEGLLDEVHPHELEGQLRAMRDELIPVLDPDGYASGSSRSFEFNYRLLMRYKGQEHTLTVRSPSIGLSVGPAFREEFGKAFEEEYLRRYGHSNQARLEVIAVELLGARKLPNPAILPVQADAVPFDDSTVESWFGLNETPIATAFLDRQSLAVDGIIEGPCIIAEPGSTTVIPPGARGTVLDDLTILIDTQDLYESQKAEL